MDIRSLRAFLTVTEEGSLSAAALRLGVAQPSLSQRIGRLEADLGGRLLVRSARGVVATALGRALLTHARAIVGAVDVATADLQRRAAAAACGARILTTPCLAPALAGAAATLRDALGAVALLTEADPARRRALLWEGRVDFAVTPTPETMEGMSWTPLWREDLQMIAATPNPDPERLMLPPRPCPLRLLVDAWAQHHQPRWRVAVELSGMEPLLTLAAQGDGWTIASPAAIAAAPIPPPAQPWPGPPLRREIGALWRVDLGLSPCGEEALRLLAGLAFCRDDDRSEQGRSLSTKATKN